MRGNENMKRSTGYRNLQRKLNIKPGYRISLQNRSIKAGKLFGHVASLKFFGGKCNVNGVELEIKSRLISRNACYHLL